MGLMRKQSKLLFIIVAIGFIAHNANGVCNKPVFTNPYAITIEPEKDTYDVDYEQIVIGCEDGHTSFGLPDGVVYCKPDGSWDPDPSTGLCYAQCNITELIQDDDVKATNENNEQQTIFNHGEVANFTCADKGQSTGSDVGTCDNGTLIVAANPTCLAYCPVVLRDLGLGLSFTVADAPVINETNTIYYRDGDKVTYSCTEGYGDPQNCTSDDCTSTCDDGSWDPPEIPMCVEPSDNTTVQTPSPTSTDGTRLSTRIPTTMSYDVTTNALRMSTTEIDECSSNPCQNNATCEDVINGYICECAEGFNGTNCEENIDDCVSHPCQNGGTCEDKIDSYECQCPDGFNGELCENEMTTMVMMTTTENVTATESGLTTVTDDVTITTSGMTTSITGATTVTLDVTTVSVTSDATTVTPDTSTVLSDATTVNADVTTAISDVATITPDVTTAMSVTSDVTSVTTDVTTVLSDVTTVTLDVTAVTPDVTTAMSVTSDVTSVTSDVTTVIPGITTVTPDTTTSLPDTSTVISDATTTISDASTTISDASTVILGATTTMSDLSTVVSDEPTTISDVSTTIPYASTTISDVSTTISDAPTTIHVSTAISDASTSISDVSTTNSDTSIVISHASTIISDASTTTPDASTAISDGTSHIPTATQATTVSSTTIPAITTSSTALPETTEASSVQSTSPLARETTTTTPTTPKRTEKPHTTPLPCKGECLPTQVCNVRNNTCECRSGYYKDETDSETPCKEPVSIDVTLTITDVNGAAANFTEELNNSTSKEFKELESEVCQPFNEIYADDPEFLGCQVLNFSKGSIKVNYVLKFAENTTQNPSTVNQTIQDKLVNSNGSFADEFTIDPDTIVVEPLNECNKELDDCDGNAKCIDEDEKGYTCVCNPGYEDSVKSLPGRDCIPRTSTEPPLTESQTNKPETTTEPEEAGLVPWKVIVGVTVPIVGILTITTIGLTCWQYRRQHRTSPSPSKKMNTFPYDEEDKRNSSARPDSMRIINSDGTVQEVVLPWRNFVPEAEFIFGQDSNKRQTQMLPMVDYPNDYSGSTSDENYPMRNIHDAYDNYTYEHHDTRRNTSEIDHVDTGNFF
nr:mucin-17-like [Lytechinus pictus]